MARTLVSTLNSGVSLPAESISRLQAIDNQDLGFVRKKVAFMLRERGVEPTDDFLDRGMIALKQYYAVGVIDGANAHAINKAIDPFWHAHLLFTERYRQFCQDVAGYFMAHEPLDFDNAGEVNHAMSLYAYTLRVLGERMELDPQFWTVEVQNGTMCSHVESISDGREEPLSVNPSAPWRKIWNHLSPDWQERFANGLVYG